MELRLQSLSQSRDRSAGIRFRIGVVLTAALTCCLSTSAADDTKPDAANAGDKVQPESAQLAFVRDKVRPLLESRCFECHGPKGEAKGGLRLTSRQAML
ncbi:MAG: hypothetical protein KDA81_19405, partial [Planctomycetaceae bacterium]|nr:hypothetical protein [Planctomycetaceae bacterium]